MVHYNWHWFWQTGNGEIGNQGVHQMDIARWAIRDAPLPHSVISLGGRWVNSTEGHPPYTDQAQTPNTVVTTNVTFQAPPLTQGTVAWDYYYLGSVAAALGYTMQATVAAWLMATITP